MTTLTCAHCKASFTHAHYCPLGSAGAAMGTAEDRALTYARELARLRAENQRLRTALEEVVSWSSRKAEQHGRIGVREFALQVLENDGSRDEPTCDDATKVRWIFRYVAQLPDPMRRKVIAKLSADYIEGVQLSDGTSDG